MDDFNTYEYGAEQKSEGKYKTLRRVMLSAYILYVVAFFLAIYITRIFPLGALIPVTLWIIVYFTWRYVKPDYKYIIAQGDMTFTVGYGKKKKATKPKTSFKVSKAIAIAPHNTISELIREHSPKHTYSAVPSAKASDVYAALYNNEKGEACVFYFVATAQALKLLRFLNSRTVVTATEV